MPKIGRTVGFSLRDRVMQLTILLQVRGGILQNAQNCILCHISEFSGCAL